MRPLITLATVLGLVPTPLLADEPRPLDARVDAVLARHGEGVVASVWVGKVGGPALYTRSADAVRPTASAIKTPYLVELFATYADALDKAPAGLDAVLADGHPAVAPFSQADRAEVRKGLTGASVRSIGRIMMGSQPAPNVVYNAAANVTTALLGGPEGLTRAIRARDPAFNGISVRRYMLAPRDVTGDNEATVGSLAAVLGRVASGTIPGLDAATAKAVREAVLTGDEPPDFQGKGPLHHKDGALNSDPPTRVHSGWWEPKGGGPPLVYVVMVAQPKPGKGGRDETGARLEATSWEIARMALEDAAPAKQP